jgi:hypothetical protein
MKLAIGEAKKAIVSAVSSGDASRPNGTLRISFFMWSVWPSTWMSGVSTYLRSQSLSVQEEKTHTGIALTLDKRH